MDGNILVAFFPKDAKSQVPKFHEYPVGKMDTWKVPLDGYLESIGGLSGELAASTFHSFP